MPTEDLYKESFTLPSVPHQAATRTALSLAPKAAKGERLVTQCWNQQGISVSWSHLHSQEGFLFSQQPWEVTPHRCWDWICSCNFISGVKRLKRIPSLQWWVLSRRGRQMTDLEHTFPFFSSPKSEVLLFHLHYFPWTRTATRSHNHTETTSVQINLSRSRLFSVLTAGLDWIPHSLSWWCYGSFKVTAMTMICFIFWFAVCFSVHRGRNLFLKISLGWEIYLKKNSAWKSPVRYLLLSVSAFMAGRGRGFEFLQIPLLPGRDGQALRGNYISTWQFVISVADMNLPEAFKTALASRPKWEFQPRALFICHFMLLIFC